MAVVWRINKPELFEYVYWLIVNWEKISMKSESKYILFHSIKWIENFVENFDCLRNVLLLCSWSARAFSRAKLNELTEQQNMFYDMTHTTRWPDFSN